MKQPYTRKDFEPCLTPLHAPPRHLPFLKERLATLKLRLSSLGEGMVALERQIGAKGGRITPEKVERFAAAMRARLHDAGDPQVRRRYVRAFVGEVVMSREQIVIGGPNRALELAAAGDMPADDEIRTFMGNWRPVQDKHNGYVSPFILR